MTTAKSTYAQAVQARKKAEPGAQEFLAQLRAALVAFYGRGSTALSDYGMSAKKSTSQTSKTAILAAAKRALTRQKRGTLGSKQKASIKAIGTPLLSVGESGVQITPAVRRAAHGARRAQFVPGDPGAGWDLVSGHSGSGNAPRLK